MMRIPFSFFLAIPISLLAGRLLGEVEHYGFLGVPFNGYGQDDRTEVMVQYGSTADLSVPDSLSAYSQTSSLPAGGSSNLNVSLLLDDSTITMLDPKLVEWSVSNTALQIRDGSMLAESLPERTTVRVRARAEGFSASLTIFILPREKPVSDHLPQSLRSAIELEAKGWKESDWFGAFYDAENGWLYHAHQGWIHVSEGGLGATWFWSSGNQWVWTEENVYPHLYRNRDSAWLYFFKEALPAKIFYNHKTETMERLSSN